MDIGEFSGISIPLGTIKRCMYEQIDICLFRISIPLGTIKRTLTTCFHTSRKAISIPLGTIKSRLETGRIIPFINFNTSWYD